MEKFDISRVDVHSLRVIVMTYERGSLTQAALALGMSQSSLSYTLARMREVLRDPLFVQQGRALVPTTTCTALVPGIKRLLDDFAALLRPQVFNAATACKTIRLCCNYYERAVLLPELVSRIRASGPNLRIEVSSAETDGHLTLLDGKADVLLSPIVADQSGLMVRTLFDEHYVCVMHKEDPAQSNFNLDAYMRARHIAVDYDRGWKPFYRRRLQEMGLQIEPDISLPSFGALQALLQLGGYVVTVPSRLAAKLGPDSVTVPAPFHTTFSIRLFWAERDRDDSFSQWLRALIVDAADAMVR